ncbi:putative polysaccharide biosynthesis protein [Brevibacillus ginsengisoli]|uniref:putative polysaccharide biosynthesis protein n=1 Tax=Brevibacillus ginsengisoli TaxID=363854 RepID=UPI003CF39DCE
MSKKSHFLSGALILAAAGILSKVIGMFYRIPLQSIVGNNGLGLYQEVYPLYLTFLILATAGVPVALSRMIAEVLAEGKQEEIKPILARSMLMMGGIGVILFALLYVSSPFISMAMGNPHLVSPIRAISLSLLFVPLIAVLRGFFYGQQKMLIIGVSQVIEQALRVSFILIASLYLVSLGEDTDAVITGVNIGTVISSSLSFVILIGFYVWHLRREPLPQTSDWRKQAWWADRPFYRKMWQISWPICVSALVIPIFSLVDSFLAINIFRSIWHLDAVMADTWFGIYSRGGPLLQLASLFGASIALSIVPAIAIAKQKGDQKEIQGLTRISYRFAWLIGLPAGFGLTAISKGANLALYGDTDGTGAMAILGISAITLSMLLATNGILQGLGQEKVPARHLAYGVGMKIVATLVFTSWLGMDGLALSWVVATSFTCALNIRVIRRLVPIKIHVRKDFVYPLIVAILMLVLAWGTSNGVMFYLSHHVHLGQRLLGAVQTVAGVGVGLIFYLGMAFIVPLLDKSELEWLPGSTYFSRVLESIERRR